uniref:Uncharacterized protein n=1 Tax=Knipowitschia caucasica TaxID=637954 RepID=A0AAV2MM65_KNICA
MLKAARVSSGRKPSGPRRAEASSGLGGGALVLKLKNVAAVVETETRAPAANAANVVLGDEMWAARHQLLDPRSKQELALSQLGASRVVTRGGGRMREGGWVREDGGRRGGEDEGGRGGGGGGGELLS